MDEIPDNWWRNSKYISVALDTINRFILGLFLAVRNNGFLDANIYTGFVQEFQGHFLWMSTKHEIENIIEVINHPDTVISSFAWLDRCEIEGASSITVHDQNLQYHLSERFDIGLIHIEGLDLSNLEMNERFIFISPKTWFDPTAIIPDGFYMIGYPKEYGNLSPPVIISESQAKYSFTSDLSYIPIVEAEYRSVDPSNSFWDDVSAFYGQILPYEDINGFQPISISGMSGGPLVAVSRDNKAREVRAYIAGIQSAWLKSGRIIRAEPIDRVNSFLQEIF